MTSTPSRRIEFAGRTHVGCKRQLNEDSYRIAEDLSLMVVADGMGGHEKGEVASRVAADGVVEFLQRRSALDTGGGDAFRRQLELLRDAVGHGNLKVFQENAAQGFPEGVGMGTTIVGARLLRPADHIGVFHVGDSRLYRWRDGELAQLTRDHTLYQDWLDHGRQGVAPRRNIILRALGPWPMVEVEVALHRVYSGDVYLACTDGLSGMVEDSAIAAALGALDDGATLDRVCDELIEMANAAGGDDNITVLLARCR